MKSTISPQTKAFMLPEATSPMKQQKTKASLGYCMVGFCLLISGCQAPISDISTIQPTATFASSGQSLPDQNRTAIVKPAAHANSMQSLQGSIDYLTPVEQQVIALHNTLRADPAGYAERYLQPLLSKFKGNLLFDKDLPNGIDALTTVEGKSAVIEAISFLKRQPPLTAMTPAHALSKSARDHANDQRSGRVGHDSSDGRSLLDRFKRHGKDMRHVAENISYGPYTAERVLNSLLIDDGVADRGHRKAIFSPKYHQIGVAISKHRQFGTVTVVHYADKITSKN